MSKGFLWFGLLFSGLMLMMGLTHLNTAKLWVIIFWFIIGIGSACKLFGKSSQPS